MGSRAISESRALETLRRALRSRRGKQRTWVAIFITVLALLRLGFLAYEGFTLARLLGALVFVGLTAALWIWALRNPLDLPDELDLDRLLRIDGLREAEVIITHGKRMTVRLADGVELVWAARPGGDAIRAGDQVWLTPPAARGGFIVAVAPPLRETGEPIVLWPTEVAWTRGRWD